MIIWNPWHGCHKISEGCQHCYMYFLDGDVQQYLATGQIEEVLCGGENYDGARPCHYEWVKKLSDQCRKHDVTFDFIETGTVFVKEGKTYRIPDKRTQSLQAYKSGLIYKGKDIDFKLTNPEPGFFEMDSAGSPTVEAYTPFFREHCKTCGSRMTCNGCSNCGNCD